MYTCMCINVKKKLPDVDMTIVRVVCTVEIVVNSLIVVYREVVVVSSGKQAQIDTLIENLVSDSMIVVTGSMAITSASNVGWKRSITLSLASKI